MGNFKKLDVDNLKYYKNENGDYIIGSAGLSLENIQEVSNEEYFEHVHKVKKKLEETLSLESQLADIMDAICELGNVVDQAITEHENALIELAEILEGE